jgi:diguanylate cyclase (GGDEF)-like protein
VDESGRRGFWRSRGSTATAVPSGVPAGPAAPSTGLSSATLLHADERARDGAVSAVLDATRALLWIETRTEAASLTRSLVEMLGGEVVPAQDAGGDTVPVDVSFGAGEPALPAAPRGSAARTTLEMHVASFVEDTHRALALADRTTRLVEEASVDPLTGVSNRRMLDRTLCRLRQDDTVIVLDLDHFKAVNDTLGHDEGDRVLRVLGKVLNESVRASDRVGRYGGEEFVVVLSGGQADPFLRRFQAEWRGRRPHPVSFSAGVAPAEPGPRAALKAADRAMYRAKLNGRDQWQWATHDEYAS